MSETKEQGKHTPGPWKLSGCEMQRNGFRNPMVECRESHEPLVAEMYGQDRTFGEKQANARLIAAAPELLEACKGLTLLIENMHDLFGANPTGEWMQQKESYRLAKAAIIKAEGRR